MALRVENIESATAMALLAFQGRGFTHKADPSHKYNTCRATRLATTAAEPGRKRATSFAQGPTITASTRQAQCAIALCELFGMTRDEAYREPAPGRTIDYLLSIQAEQGGWRYLPWNRQRPLRHRAGLVNGIAKRPAWQASMSRARGLNLSVVF